MKTYMSLREMAERTGHDRDALRQRKRRGVLGIEPVAQVGPSHLYDRKEAETWIARNKKESK